MSSKTHDVTTKVGEFQQNGETKARWKNVGSLIKTDKGSMVLLLDRTFNPAGVPGEGNSESVMLQFFKVDNDRQQQKSQAPVDAGNPYEDDIPFS